MKNLILGLVSFFAMMAQADSTPSPIDGTWVIVDRSCSSGAPVRDGFWMDRDSWQITFHKNHFESVRTIMSCKYWSSGDFAINGHFLELIGVIGASNCTQQGPYPRSTHVFYLEENLLKIYINANSRGAACPLGDVLETVFQLVE